MATLKQHTNKKFVTVYRRITTAITMYDVRVRRSEHKCEFIFANKFIIVYMYDVCDALTALFPFFISCVCVWKNVYGKVI